MSDDNDYGAIIFQKRQREGWSRRELEALSGVSQNKIVRIETAGRDLTDEEFRALIRVVPELAQAEQEPPPESKPEPPRVLRVPPHVFENIQVVEIEKDVPIELINDYDRQPEPAPLPLLSTVLDIPQDVYYPPIVLGEPPSAEDGYPESSTSTTQLEKHHQTIDDVYTTSPVGVDALYEGPARLISNSEFQTFKHCRRRWWLAYYRGLQLKDKPLTGPAPLGTRIHEALEHYYVPPTETPADPLETLEASITRDKRLVLVQYADLPERAAEELDKFNKDAEYARAMVEGYMDWLSETGADQGLEVIQSEKTLSTDLTNIPGSDTPVRIRGKVDAELRREADNSTLFMDHKTVGDFTRPAMKLRLDEQTKTYQLLEEDNRSEDSPGVDGALYNMIRRVKRTQSAKPPFYQRLEIHRGPHEIDTFRSRLIGTSADILLVETLLKDGHDHHQVVYPSPGDRCHWGCDFKHVCPMFDDNSRAEDFISSYYVSVNPMDRYNDNAKGDLE